LVQIDTNRVIKVVGSKLADGQNFAPYKVGLGKNGEWPLFSVANKSTAGSKPNLSAIMGWMTVTPSNLTAVEGTLTWAKEGSAPANGDPSPYYPNGFTNQPALASSPYYALGFDPAALMIIQYAQGTSNTLVTFEGGGLLNTLSNSVTWLVADSKNKLTTDKVRKMTLSVTSKTGKLATGFTHPQDNDLKASGAGVVLTNSMSGYGYFLPSKEGTVLNSGRFTVEQQTP
jgi:hypothetical protein